MAVRREGLKVWKWEKEDLCDRKGACERACDRLCSRVCVCRSHSLQGCWPNVELNFLQTLSCQVMFPSHTAWHHHKYSAGKQARARQSPLLKHQPVKWLHPQHTHQIGNQSHPSPHRSSPNPGGPTLIHPERALTRHKLTRALTGKCFSITQIM